MKKISAGLLAIVALFVTIPIAARAQVSTGEKVAASDIPSVYQIFAVADATITFPQFSVDSAMDVNPDYQGVSAQVIATAEDLENKIYNNGEDSSTAQAEERAQGIGASNLATAMDVINNPQKYTKQQTFSEKTIIQSGSGFAIDENGYIVTNAHVVQVANSDVQEALINDYVNGSSTDSVFSSSGVDPLSDNGQTLSNNLYDYLEQYTAISSSTTSYKILPPSVARSTSLDDVINDGWSASSVYQGDPYPGKDVALLKLSLKNKIPALTLSPTDPNVGDSVYVIGFPGVANLTQDIENQATFTAGSVSAVRKSDSGDFSVFQTDASSGEGSSGGPVLNAAGDVVGFLTLGSENTGGGNFNYFLPVSLISEMVNTADVTISPNRSVTNAYREGVDLLESGNCDAGKADIAGVQNSLDSDFISQMIANCAPSASAFRLSPWWAALIAFVIVIIVLLSLWYHRRLSKETRRRHDRS